MPPVKKPPRQYRKHFLRQWREKRFPTMTMEWAADALNIDRTTLGRIEKGQSPYSQGLLEAAAELYSCEPWDLLNRDPSKEGQVIDLVDRLRQATPDEVNRLMGYYDSISRNKSVN